MNCTLDIIEIDETENSAGLRKMAWRGTSLVQWIVGTGNVIELLEVRDGGPPRVRTSAEIIKFPVRIQRKKKRAA